MGVGVLGLYRERAATTTGTVAEPQLELNVME